MNLPELIFRKCRPLVWLFVAALTLVAGAGIAQLRFVDDPSNLLLSTDANDERSQATRELEANFGSAEDYCYVVVHADKVLSPEVLQTVGRLREEISGIPEVAFVASILDLRSQSNVGEILPPLLSTKMSQESIDGVADRVLQHPLARRSFLSADGRTTLLAVRPKSDLSERRDLAPLLMQLDAAVKRVNAPQNVRLSLAGWPLIQRNVIHLLQVDQVVFTSIALAAAALAGWILFRNVYDLLIMVTPSLFGVIWAHGLLGWVGQDLNLLTVVMAPLILVIGFTDSVHMLMFVRRRQSRGMDAPDAVIAMLRRIGPACVQTSLTTAVGFGALSLVASPSIRAFGLCCAAGAGFVLIAVLTIVPLMCWRRKAPAADGRRTEFISDAEVTRLARKLQRWVRKRPARIALAGTALTLALCWVATGSQIDYRFSENLSETHQASKTMRELDRQFGGAMTLQVVIHWPEDRRLSSPEVETAIRAATDCIENHPMTSNTLSITTVADSLPGRSFKQRLAWLRKAPPLAVGSLVRPGLNQSLITARVHDVGSRALHPQLLDLEAELGQVEQAHPGFRFDAAGLTALSIHRSQSMLHELTTSLMVAGGIILVILAISFRSLRWGLLAVVPNLLPLAATTSLLVLIGEPLRFSSLLALTVSLGVVVDDSIHMLWHIRRRLNDGLALPEAISDAQRRLFLALGTTTLLLLIGFGVTLGSRMPMIQLFGALACCSLLMALVADLVLLPALMLVGAGKQRLATAPPRKSRRRRTSSSANEREPGEVLHAES